MSLTYPQIQRLTELQLVDFKLAGHISSIKKALHQLADDHCVINLSFHLHNNTRCQENEAKQTSTQNDLVNAMSSMFLGMAPVKTDESTTCTTMVSYQFNECSGLRILGVVLKEKETERAMVKQEMEVLLKQIATEDLIDNALTQPQ
jgi:hypothetical protein